MKTTTITRRLKGIPIVKPLRSPRTGEAVKNQYELQFDNGSIFQSYSSLIAIKCDGKLYVTDKYSYSRTTVRYLNQFTGLDKKTIDNGIKNKDIILCK